MTGKQHKDVLHDIRKMLDELGLDAPEFSGTYRTERGNAHRGPTPAMQLAKKRKEGAA